MMFGKPKQSSAKKAAKRLIVTLTQDRTNLSEAKLEMMKNDILQVISKYVSVDETDIDVNIQNDEHGVPILIANIPVKDALRSVPKNAVPIQ